MLKKHFTQARISRLLVSVLLFIGLDMPLLAALDAMSGFLPSLFIGLGILLTFSVTGSFRKGRLWLILVAAAAILFQFILPDKGLFGSCEQAIRALSLQFNHVDGTSALFAKQIGLLLGLVLPIASYAFATRTVGFLPATILVVLMLFGICTLGRTDVLWYTAPAFIALLLLISQTSHENNNLLEVAPMAAIVLTAALLLLPKGQTVITPLYEKAMDLKQKITDYLFFSEERTLFTIAQYGFYPSIDEKGDPSEWVMGGAISPSDAAVMKVETEQKVLLRGISKDYYTGRYWAYSDSLATKRYQYVNRRFRSLREKVFGENLPSASVQASTSLTDQKAINVVLVAENKSTLFTPVTLRSYAPVGNLAGYFNERGELFTTRNLQAGDKYTVFAPVFEGGSDEMNRLMSVLPLNRRTMDDSFYAIYLQLPDHVKNEATFQSRVNSMIEGASTDYEKACRIMTSLTRGVYRYDESASVPPANKDFVLNFLFESGQNRGYCVHFASAMTVMCRMAGIPARYVEGFRCCPASDGVAYVTVKCAHAWTEVWIEGFGWIPFDPTPLEDTPNEPPEDQQPTPTPTPTPTPPPEDNNPTPPPEDQPPEDDLTNPPDQPEEEPDDSEKPPFAWWLLLIAAVLGLCAWRFVYTSAKATASRTTTVADHVFVYGSALHTLLAMRGIAPKQGETPLAFARRVDKRQLLPTAVLPIYSMMLACRYAGGDLKDTSAAASEKIFNTCFAPQPLLMKLLFRLKALPGKGVYDALDTRMNHEQPKSQYGWMPSGSSRLSANGREQLRRLFGRPEGEPPAEPAAPAAPVQEPLPQEDFAETPAAATALPSEPLPSEPLPSEPLSDEASQRRRRRANHS